MTTARRVNEIRDALERCYDESDVAAYKAWARNIGTTDYSEFEDAYQGEYADEMAFTEQLVDDLGMLDSMPENLRGYFDYDTFRRDLFMSDYYSLPSGSYGVYVFRHV